MLDAIASNSNAFTSTQVQEQAAKNAAVAAEDLRQIKNEEATQKTRALPPQEETQSDGRKKDSLELTQEAQEIQKLQMRDKEVRAHEAAHSSVGGSYAGSPSYSYERGPDGQSYAVGGEVSIDVSPISGDPEATLQKAQQVRAAALAPAQPSGQDMKVAQRAQSMAANARAELAQQQSRDVESPTDELSTSGSLKVGEDDTESTNSELSPATPTQSAGPFLGARASLSYYA